MPHNDSAYRNFYGQPGPFAVPTPGILRQLDLLASQSIDGDNGGTWNPANPIVVGGSGLQLTNQGTMSGGFATGPQAPPRALVLAAGDFPIAFDLQRTRTVVFPLRDFLTRADEMAVSTSSVQPYDEGAPGTMRVVLQTSNSTSTRLAMLLTPSRIMMGGFITDIALRMRVGTANLLSIGGFGASSPSGLTGLPGFRLTRVLANGSVLTTGELAIPAWVASRAYNQGDLVIPTTANGRQFRCAVAGTSGGAQPATFTTAATGVSVVDGTVTWTCEVGPANGAPHYFTLPLKALASDYYAQGQPQDIVLPPNIAASLSAISQTDYVTGYLLDILDRSNSQNTFHSLRMSFSSTFLRTNV